MTAQRLVRRLPVGDSVVEAILDLVRAGPARDERRPAITDKLLWGPGPRASQALMLAVRARALIEGRVAPSIDDVIALAEPVLKHRMALTFAARADGETIPGLIRPLAARFERTGGTQRMTRTRVLPTRARSPGRRETDAALALADRMPRLVLEARRVAASLVARPARPPPGGARRELLAVPAVRHRGGRRSGSTGGVPARDDRLYVREREWEAAHKIWLWIDRSASMAFASDLPTRRRSSAPSCSGLRSPTPSWRAASASGLLGLTPPARDAPASSSGWPRRSSPTAPASTPTCRRARPLGRLDEAVI